ncbi:hypothetical protein HanIR_Chr14g0696521 [Helianthus annuus]|nr:hypothetical protein HanIR_Chr14g0696521 [Helianthus annuus]
MILVEFLIVFCCVIVSKENYSIGKMGINGKLLESLIELSIFLFFYCWSMFHCVTL